jgi:hypothetical protein
MNARLDLTGGHTHHRHPHCCFLRLLCTTTHSATSKDSSKNMVGESTCDWIRTFLDRTAPEKEENFEPEESELRELDFIPDRSRIAASRWRIFFFSRRSTTDEVANERVQASSSGVLQYATRDSIEHTAGDLSSPPSSESSSELTSGAIDQKRPLVAPSSPPETTNINKPY